MFKIFLLTAALAILVRAHGDNDHEDQVLIAGPHESLWYNALPGDGGTQVGLNQLLSLNQLAKQRRGRLCIQRDRNVWTFTVSPLSCKQGCEV